MYFTAHPLTPLNPGVSALQPFLLRCNATFYVEELGALFFVGEGALFYFGEEGAL